MNTFYTYPKLIQWVSTLVLSLIAFGIMGFWLTLTAYHIAFYLLLFILVPILQFALTPLFRLIGLYKYLSPMLLVYAPSEKKYDLHNGTSFDYLFVMRKVEPGTSFQHAMLYHYVSGLLKIVSELEAGTVPPTLEISGTSYFFSASTAERLGFALVAPSGFYKFNLYLNYLDLLWMYSLAKGKLTFPKLGEIKAATTSGERLLQKKEYLEKLYRYLSVRNAEYLKIQGVGDQN